MQVAAHTVPRVVLNDRIAVGFNMVLNRTGQIQETAACFNGGQALHQGLLGDSAEPLAIDTQALTYGDGDATIAVVPLETGARIHLEQITGVDHPLGTGDAMHNLIVDGGANTGRETVVALKAGHRPHGPDPLFGMAIQVGCSHARGNHFTDFPQHSGHDATGPAHHLNLTG